MRCLCSIHAGEGSVGVGSTEIHMLSQNLFQIVEHIWVGGFEGPWPGLADWLTGWKTRRKIPPERAPPYGSTTPPPRAHKFLQKFKIKFKEHKLMRNFFSRFLATDIIYLEKVGEYT